MSTDCANCNRKFKTFEDYARHILAKHSDDDIRTGWAKELLNSHEPEETVEVTTEEPRSEVDAALESVLRPEVLARLRSIDREQTAAAKLRAERAAPKTPEVPKAPATGIRRHTKKILVGGVILVLLIIIGVMCNALYY